MPLTIELLGADEAIAALVEEQAREVAATPAALRAGAEEAKAAMSARLPRQPAPRKGLGAQSTPLADSVEIVELLDTVIVRPTAPVAGLVISGWPAHEITSPHAMPIGDGLFARAVHNPGYSGVDYLGEALDVAETAIGDTVEEVQLGPSI